MIIIYKERTREKMDGSIFNIQRFSVYDGPGIRTVVFFSGCNLSCAWCHNPESIKPSQQLKYNASQCINCLACAEVCDKNAHIRDETGAHKFTRDKCTLCMKCTEVCYAEALLPVIKKLSPENLLKSIMTDLEYYRQSEGGVTFSGGEPMIQADFLLEILKLCKENGIYTAVDTAGNVKYDSFEKILPYCDLILYDIKAVDRELHKKLTGVYNDLILDNIKRLSVSGKEIYVRVPCVKNGNYDDMDNIIGFVSKLGIKKTEFLNYHALGTGKLALLGIDLEQNNNFGSLTEEELNELYKKLNCKREA